MNHPVIIDLVQVVVDFNGFKALNLVDFYVDHGELRFLIGPNGAGKTTLLDVICRKVKPSSGRITYDGNTDLGSLDVSAVARLGIARKFQAPSVFPRLTVWENMELAWPNQWGALAGLWSKLPAEASDKIGHLLETLGLADRRYDRAAGLSHGQKQWLEIGLTLVQDPQLLLVDEPVAGMTRAERTRTGEILTAIAKERSVLVVEHDMHFVEQFSKMVTVLHEGQLICEGSFAHVSSDERVREVYLGRGKEE